jgi:coenzyme F420 hydrogenase subunit alpha
VIYLTETVVISPTTRQEGHAELSMEVNEEGIVTTGRYFSITPVRGLEKMVVGRSPETAPVLVQRICGVCPVTHTLASVEAIDDSLKIEAPKAGKILREICLNAHIINSHAIHHFLIAPDFVPEDKYEQAVREISEIRKQVQFVQDTIGGEGIHPSDIRIGGMAHNITKNAQNKIRTRIDGVMKLLVEHSSNMKAYVEQKEFPENLGTHNQDILATSDTYGSKNNFAFNKVEELMPEAWYDDPKIGKRACSTIPLYDGAPVETGPRARASKYRKFNDKGVKAQHIARSMEMVNSAERILELIDQLNTSAPVQTDYNIEGTNRLGIGVIEGPRGTNVHMAKIGSDRKISQYNAIVPTTWNIPTMGIATEGYHYDYAPHVIRAYDPCLSCATHMLVVDDETKDVIKSDMVQL